MLENLITSFLKSQFGDVRRRTKGAILEAAALGMFGLAAVLLFTGLFLGLSLHMAPYLAAVLLSVISFGVASALMIFGKSLLKRKEPDPHEQAVSAMKAMGLVSRGNLENAKTDEADEEPGLAMIAAALAAGLMLGRSIRR